jgi:hypothetical protein
MMSRLSDSLVNQLLQADELIMTAEFLEAQQKGKGMIKNDRVKTTIFC